MTYHLAQYNIGRMRGRIGEPVMAEFVANLDRINAEAEASPGFVWRLSADAYTEDNLCPLEDKHIIVNLSVWESVETLRAYVYRSGHGGMMRRRKEWFIALDVHYCLWWVRAGTTPTLEAGMARLEHLRAQGESAEAFTFRRPFPPPG